MRCGQRHGSFLPLELSAHSRMLFVAHQERYATGGRAMLSSAEDTLGLNEFSKLHCPDMSLYHATQSCCHTNLTGNHCFPNNDQTASCESHLFGSPMEHHNFLFLHCDNHTNRSPQFYVCSLHPRPTWKWLFQSNISFCEQKCPTQVTRKVHETVTCAHYLQ